MSKNFLNALKNKKYLILDGAMGTQLQKFNLLNKNIPPELLNIKNGDTITQIHSSYIDAGADIIETNTFGANEIKMNAFDMRDRVEEFVFAAVKCARKASEKNSAFVALSVGPTGKLLAPLGDLTFENAYDVFSEQISAGLKAGVDLVLIETMSDFQEVKAAVLAAKHSGADAIAVSMTFEPDGKTITGIDALSATAFLQSLNLAAFGSNCSTGPDLMTKNVVNKMLKYSTIPLLFFPNAGLPELKNGETFFPLTPDDLAEFAANTIARGAKIVGGCCGTTPEYISAIKRNLEVFSIPERTPTTYHTMLCSRSQTIVMDESFKFLVVGERINPNARKAVKESLKQNRMTAIRREAISQTAEKADMLDVNISIPSIDEPATMKKAVFNIQNVVDMPLSIDSPNMYSIESGLKAFAGRALVNSINAKTNSIDNLIPLVADYGAAIIALPLDANGVPETAEGRIKYAEKIVNAAVRHNIRREDIFVDGITLTISSNPESAIETLKTLSMAKKELGVKTILGLSNISFGLPNRALVNKSFLAMAIAFGLDAAIINPQLPELADIINASAVLLNKKDAMKYFISDYSSTPNNGAAVKPKEIKSAEDKAYNAVLTGDTENIIDFITEILREKKPLEITNDILIPAIKEVGDLYDTGKYFLPQLIMSGDTMHRAFRLLRPLIKKDELTASDKIVIATVEGDIHDIGKNIVGVMLENYGLDVIDLGKSIPNKKILQSAIENHAKIVGLSALMTTTMPEMAEFIVLKNEKFPSLKVIIGGAAVTAKFAEEIGADGYSADAVGAAKLAKKLLGSSL